MAADASLRGRPLSSREWRTILGGLLVVLGALVGTRGLGPRWATHQRRAAEIARDEARLASLEGMAASRDTLERVASALERTLAGRPRRLLRAATPALGGSALQQYLESAVEGAGMVVDRVDVTPATADGATEGPIVLSAQLSVIGDIHGLAALLATVERGPRVVTVDRLAVRRTSALRGAPDVLQVTLGLTAPLRLEEESP